MKYPIALLPGSLCDDRVFAHQAASLAAAGHDVRVVELRPHISIESMAAHVAESIDGPFVAIGLSMGAIVAAELATICPERLAGVGLLATNLDTPSAEQLATRRRWETTVRTGKLWQLVAQELVPVSTSFPERHGELIFAMAEAAGSAGFLSENHALLHRHDRRPLVERLPAPVLIACGADDVVCPPTIHHRLAARTPGARLHVVPDAGHLLTIDQPTRLSDLLVEWLDHVSNENQFQEGNHAHDHA